jgi:hypothetical protein
MGFKIKKIERKLIKTEGLLYINKYDYYKNNVFGVIRNKKVNFDINKVEKKETDNINNKSIAKNLIENVILDGTLFNNFEKKKFIKILWLSNRYFREDLLNTLKLTNKVHTENVNLHRNLKKIDLNYGDSDTQ